MEINDDKKVDILLALLKERYDASHKMRDRSLKFTLWISGFAIAIIWIVLNDVYLGHTQKLLLTFLVIIIEILTLIFLTSISSGFDNNRNVMISFERALGCYELGKYIKENSIYPNDYKDTKKKGSSHFISLYVWIIAIGILVILVIWSGAC